MSTSLTTPPANPTTAASTTTPNRSSLARTAANPPLRPNTNVPARLRTRISVGLKPSGTSPIQPHLSQRPYGDLRMILAVPGQDRSPPCPWPVLRVPEGRDRDLGQAR